jgi:hypothetical protein
MRSISAEAPGRSGPAGDPALIPGPASVPQHDPTAVYLIATSSDQDRTDRAALAAALHLAGEAGAAVILYDRSAESGWTDPYESSTRLPELLNAKQLRGYGRGRLADQLEAVAASGLHAHATLAWGTGPAAMATACQELGVTHVILPAALSRPSLRDRLFHCTLEDYQAALAGVRILLVDERGALDDTARSRHSRLQAATP